MLRARCLSVARIGRVAWTTRTLTAIARRLAFGAADFHDRVHQLILRGATPGVHDGSMQRDSPALASLVEQYKVDLAQGALVTAEPWRVRIRRRS
jgi:hypothetical protein